MVSSVSVVEKVDFSDSVLDGLLACLSVSEAVTQPKLEQIAMYLSRETENHESYIFFHATENVIRN